MIYYIVTHSTLDKLLNGHSQAQTITLKSSSNTQNVSPGVFISDRTPTQSYRMVPKGPTLVKAEAISMLWFRFCVKKEKEWKRPVPYRHVCSIQFIYVRSTHVRISNVIDSERSHHIISGSLKLHLGPAVDIDSIVIYYI